MADTVSLLRAELGDDLVRFGSISDRYCCDWSGIAPAKPLAVVLPRTTAEVAATLKLCNSIRQSVVPQGGRTGMAGGATPRNCDVVLSLERMAAVEQIDSDAATMTVQAGVTLQAAQEAASAAGWVLGLDLGSRSSCQIGGNISTNAGGVHVIKYGTTRNHVVGLEVVLPDGTVLSDLKKMVKNNTGYDLKQLFIGAEGTLGIVARAVLRLFPQPSVVATLLCGMRSFEACQRLLRLVQAEVGDVSAFEVMWPAYYRFVVHAMGGSPPLDPDMPMFCLVEIHGMTSDILDSRLEMAIERANQENLILATAVANSKADARRFWAIRDGYAIDALPHLVNFDLGLAPSEMATFVNACDQRILATWPESFRFWFGHIADGNLHLSVSLGDASIAAISRLEDIVYSATAESGGSISAEHGIGTLKQPYLRLSRSHAELMLMRLLKSTLDPNGIMNPGKIL